MLTILLITAISTVHYAVAPVGVVQEALVRSHLLASVCGGIDIAAKVGAVITATLLVLTLGTVGDVVAPLLVPVAFGGAFTPHVAATLYGTITRAYRREGEGGREGGRREGGRQREGRRGKQEPYLHTTHTPLLIYTFTHNSIRYVHSSSKPFLQ